MFNIIHPSNFTSIYSLLTTDGTVFIIPNFQRPYAWEEDHVRDLLEDIDKAGGMTNPYHYL